MSRYDFIGDFLTSIRNASKAPGWHEDDKGAKSLINLRRLRSLQPNEIKAHALHPHAAIVIAPR